MYMMYRYDLDECKQENTEMTSKLTLQVTLYVYSLKGYISPTPYQAAELLQVQAANSELEAKLQMAELLTQQVTETINKIRKLTNH